MHTYVCTTDNALECVRLGLKCVYPPESVVISDRSDNGESTTTLPAGDGKDLIRSMPPPASFCLDDMRFMQHFLQYGHPSLPIGEPSTWMVIAQMAYKVSCPSR